MKATFYVIILAIIMLLGCTSIHHVKLDESSCNDITNKIKGKHASLTLKNGQTVKANNINLEADSTSWVEAGQNKQVVPTSGVKEITIKDRAKGAAYGFMAGCLSGLGGGAFLAYEKTTREAAYFWAGPLYVCQLTVPIGLLIGGIIGSTDKYVLNSTINVSQAPSDVSDIEVIDRSPLKVSEGGIIIISVKVGEVIDLEEQNKYNLFPTIKGFQSAVLMKSIDGNYAFKVTYLDEKTGAEKIKWISQPESQIMQIRAYIDQFDKGGLS